CIFSFAVSKELIQKIFNPNRYKILKSYKQTKCLYFKTGYCKKENSCNYIHEINEQILNKNIMYCLFYAL
ncbi:zinc finger CCCH domain-containing protein, partial [Mesonia mobilis]|uniref:zinc finger CCCH domain-containing protein n=1 Tax=Mesonia mobilis TaxID=369791 RepID=UPI0026F0324A